MNLEIQSLRRAEAATLRLRGLYESYGYRKYRMGRFEEYSLYAANKSFLLGENVPTFTDLDGRLMALKPDVTLSIAKNTKADKNTCEKYRNFFHFLFSCFCIFIHASVLS